MRDYIDKLKDKLSDKAAKYTDNYLDEKGIQVHVKTDFWPSIKVYDSDNQSDSGANSPLKYSIKITNRDGKIIKQLNDIPQTNPVKAAAIVGVVGVGAVLIMLGVRHMFEK